MLAETTKSPKSGAVQQNNCTDITSDQIPNLSPVANQLTESEPSTHVDCNIPKTVLQDVNFENSGKKKLILKDLRIFYNSLERAVTILKQTGLSPQIERQETGSRLQITISVDNPSCDCSDGLQLAENSEGGLKQEPQEII